MFGKITDKIYSTFATSHHIFNLKKRQYQRQAILANVQTKRLRNIVRHAYTHVPFYHSLYKKLGITPDDIRQVSDITKLPVITKHDIQQHWNAFVSNTAQLETCTIRKTSGTTGLPLKLLVDQSAAAINVALPYYAFFECGMHISDRFLEIGPQFPSTSKSFIQYGPGYWLKGTYLSMFNDLAHIVTELLHIQPAIIYTGPTLLGLLVEDFFNEINRVAPRLVFSQALTLYDKHRKLVNDCWGVPIHNTYGSQEFPRIAFECNAHQGLHVITDWVILELLNEGERIGPNEEGNTIVTSLYNYAMPLIRYDLGDIAVWSEEKCTCARSWPLLKKIIGRSEDAITLPSGRRTLFNGETFLAEIEGIKRFQIVFNVRQKYLIVRIVCSDTLQTSDKEKLKRETINKMKITLHHESFKIYVDFVEAIRPQPSGKTPTFILERN